MAETKEADGDGGSGMATATRGSLRCSTDDRADDGDGDDDWGSDAEVDEARTSRLTRLT
jgi:hypothetical protein